MYKRHFIVKEINGEYKLREIDAKVGDGIRRFGITTGQCRTVESIRWIFYFMNARLSEEQANIIATNLTQDFLEGQR